MEGAAAFPDKVIGEWTCYGYFIEDGSHTKDGVLVVSRQIYDFGGDDEASAIHGRPIQVGRRR
ncbi:hypothetical protein B5P45_17810 [Phyllobacterium zundukense]|uniref:Uncharacterized protein n=1 Tax=Phyllobacterium zundukense TaxID=1867719 RepID=A0A2N9VV58_9HYPH|nr:hypothetical protein BLM14_20000 [Phyllobacterium zundukense]PIO43376.1 hypothetical protein B5P45_17810 [Phyllobacterium zundukense]